MSDLKGSVKTKLKLELVKSAGMLLLALVLLVSVAFAWFESSGDEEIPIDFIAVSISSPEVSDIGLGSDVVRERNIVLPCATKINDSSIDADDFSRAVVMEVYSIQKVSDNDVKVTVLVTPDENSSDLHYYVCADYTEGTTTKDNLAKLVYDTKSLADKSVEFVMPVGQDKKVAIIYWADYDDEFEAAINSTSDGGGKYSYKANVRFKAESEVEDEG